MAPKLTVVEELRSMARFVANSQQLRSTELLGLLVAQVPQAVRDHPVRAHWAKYRAAQEFHLTYPDGKELTIYGLHEISQHLDLAIPTLRQRLGKGKGQFHTKTGILVVRV